MLCGYPQKSGFGIRIPKPSFYAAEGIAIANYYIRSLQTAVLVVLEEAG